MQSVKLKPNVLYFLISVMRKAVLNDELQSMHGILNLVLLISRWVRTKLRFEGADIISETADVGGEGMRLAKVCKIIGKWYMSQDDPGPGPGVCLIFTFNSVSTLDAAGPLDVIMSRTSQLDKMSYTYQVFLLFWL